MTSIAFRSLVLVAALGTAAYADDQMYACHEPAAGAKIAVSFKPNVSLSELATWVTGFTCKNVVFSADAEKAGQNMTIMAPKPMTPKQALQLFVDSLDTIGLVVTVKADTITVKLGAKAVARCDAAPPTDQVSVEGFKKIDDTHYQIDGVAWKKMLSDTTELAKGARFVPNTVNNKVDGYKLYAIRPSSIYAQLGFMNGDTIRTLNMWDVTNPEYQKKMLDVLPEVSSVEIEIVRRGQKMTLYFTIR